MIIIIIFYSGVKSKVCENAFDDLLSSQGFEAKTRDKANRKIADMRRDEEVRALDPVQLRIRDWTRGKERNIRALLASLSDVLWDGADKWPQPSMADLLDANQIKKYYYRACLVAHPDKQTGTDNEPLARAIFTELNDAWNEFVNAGAASL